MNQEFYGRCYEEIMSEEMIGKEVTLVELQNAAHLNRTEGTIVETLNSKNRFPVQLSSGKTIAVRPKNLLFRYIHDNAFSRLRDMQASMFEWEQARYRIMNQEDALVENFPEITNTFFTHMANGETAIKFDVGEIRNGWGSLLATFTGKPNSVNPAHPFECEEKYSIAMINANMMETWINLCAQYINNESATENSKIIFRLIGQFVANPQVIDVILNRLQVEVYKNLIEIAENMADGATQGLVLQVVGLIHEWAKKLKVRSDLVEIFAAKSQSEEMVWIMYEMLSLPIVLKIVGNGRPFGSHETPMVHRLISENMNNYDDL